MENYKLALTSEDFDRPMGIVSNPDETGRAIPLDTFKKAFPEEEYVFFNKGMVTDFISKLKDVNSELIKGEDNEEMEIFKRMSLKKAVDDVMSLHSANVEVDGKVAKIFFKKKEAVEDNLNKAENGDDLQKSDLYYALSSNYEGKPIQVKKTGKEIKAKLIAKKSEIEAKISATEEKIEEHLEETTQKPTKTYYYSDPDDTCKYKVYDWNQTYFTSTESNSITLTATDGSTLKPVSSQEQAEQNSKYNDLVYKYSALMKDLKMVEFLERNLEDATSYELSIKQLYTLGF